MAMKKIILSIFILSYLTPCVFAQTENVELKTIEKTVEGINTNLNSFQKIEKQNDSIANEYVFIKDKEVQLITIKTREQNIEKNVAWYYLSGALIYGEQKWLDIKSNAIVDHEKFFLTNGHLIAWINTENNAVTIGFAINVIKLV